MNNSYIKNCLHTVINDVIILKYAQVINNFSNLTVCTNIIKNFLFLLLSTANLGVKYNEKSITDLF